MAAIWWRRYTILFKVRWHLLRIGWVYVRYEGSSEQMRSCIFRLLHVQPTNQNSSWQTVMCLFMHGRKYCRLLGKLPAIAVLYTQLHVTGCRHVEFVLFFILRLSLKNKSGSPAYLRDLSATHSIAVYRHRPQSEVEGFWARSVSAGRHVHGTREHCVHERTWSELDVENCLIRDIKRKKKKRLAEA